jgi:1,4-dihydroxy-2-naphthoate octaprenyltransferase
MPVVALGVMMGLMCTAVLNLNNMRDRVNDKASGKNTIVVLLGFKKAKIYHYVLFILFWIPSTYALFLAFVSPSIDWTFAIGTSILLIFHLVHLRKVYKVEDPKEFDPELKKIALSTFAFSILLFITFM